MKTKPAKQPKQSKRTVKLKDIKPKKDAKAGSGRVDGRDYLVWQRNPTP